jgi:hypothetical protein
MTARHSKGPAARADCASAASSKNNPRHRHVGADKEKGPFMDGTVAAGTWPDSAANYLPKSRSNI